MLGIRNNRGVVLNDVNGAGDDVSRASNLGELAARCVPPILATVAWQAEALSDDVDWFALAEAGN